MHLVFVTDAWLGRAVLGKEEAHHRFAIRDLDALGATDDQLP